MLNSFLNQRKNKKFIIKEMTKKQLTDKLKENLFDYTKELCYLTGKDKILGFVFEENDIFTFILELTLNTQFSLENLYNINEQFRLTENEKIILSEFIYTLEQILRLVMIEEDYQQDFSKFLDMKKLVEKYNWEIYPTI